MKKIMFFIVLVAFQNLEAQKCEPVRSKTDPITEEKIDAAEKERIKKANERCNENENIEKERLKTMAAIGAITAVNCRLSLIKFVLRLFSYP